MTRLTKCQLQPYLQSATATVISCAPTPTITTTDKKTKKSTNNNIITDHNCVQQPTWDIVLNDTILYHESGGQLSDTGRLITSDQTVTVFHVKAINDTVSHCCSAALNEGSTVEIQIDWSRRYNHMQQHTGQHLISAVCQRLYNASTVSWWMSSGMNECHIELAIETFSDEQMQCVQDEGNAIIRHALPLKMHVFESVGECRSTEFSAAVDERDFEGKEAPIRVIEIPQWDVNLCGGTHLANTAELQLITIHRQDRMRGNVRIYFFAGQRAIQHFSQLLSISRTMSTLLSVNTEQQVEAVQRLQADFKLSQRRINLLAREVATTEAKQTIQRIEAGETLISIYRDLTPVQQINDVADQLLRHFTEKPLNDKWLCLLCCSELVNGKSGQFFLVGDESSVNEMASVCAEALKGRGGGRRGKFQGKGETVNKHEQAVATIRDKWKTSVTQQ